MDKIRILALLFVGVLAASIVAYAGPSRPGMGTPFEEIWNELQKLREDMMNLSYSQPTCTVVEVQGPPGPPGEQGPPGPQGEQGPQGEPSEITVNCEGEGGGEASPVLKYFIEIDGIEGESTDAEHRDWIEILGYSWGVSQSGDLHSGGGGAERADFSDLKVVKRLDKASPKLALYASNGAHIPEVNLELMLPDGSGRYMLYELKDVMVTSVVHMGGTEMMTGGETPLPLGERPIEEVTLNYGEIRWVYTEYDETGHAAGNVESHWDVDSNTGG